MFSLFSLSTPHGASSGPRAIDLQLLSDEEVLKVWQQSQMLINMLGEKDVPPHMTTYYTQLIEQELQRRSQTKPNVFYNITCKLDENGTDALTASNKSKTLANNVLTTNILV